MTGDGAPSRAAFSLPLPGLPHLVLGERTLLMGIVNLTTDSFSDGRPGGGPGQDVARCEALVADGADLLDLGAESTRPGADEVPAEVQLDRLLPVIARIRERLPQVPVSVDTRSAEVARRAVRAGAHMVNDVSGLAHDPLMRATISELGVPACVMHMRGTPSDMRERAVYADPVAEVLAELEILVEAARAAGVRHVLADPGVGFAKDAGQSLALIAALPRFAALGAPVLVGPSRKSFLRPFTREDATDPPAAARRDATVAAAALSAFLGAHVVRVHDVASCRDGVRLADALRGRVHSDQP